jgi:hypothetical protein
VLAIAGILAIGIMLSLLALLREYASFSTRGKTGIEFQMAQANTSSSAMSREYITEYSYGVAEVLI